MVTVSTNDDLKKIRRYLNRKFKENKLYTGITEVVQCYGGDMVMLDRTYKRFVNSAD